MTPEDGWKAAHPPKTHVLQSKCTVRPRTQQFLPNTQTLKRGKKEMFGRIVPANPIAHWYLFLDQFVPVRLFLLKREVWGLIINKSPTASESLGSTS
eukprot:2515377-Amphidinium_carterae.1